MSAIHRAEGGQSYEMTNLHAGGSSAGERFSQAMQSHAAPGSPQGSVASFHTADEGAGQGVTETPEPKGKGKANTPLQAPTESLADPTHSAGLGSQSLSSISAQDSPNLGVAGPSNWQHHSPGQGQPAIPPTGTLSAGAASVDPRRPSQGAFTDAAQSGAAETQNLVQPHTGQANTDRFDHAGQMEEGGVSAAHAQPTNTGGIEGDQPARRTWGQFFADNAKSGDNFDKAIKPLTVPLQAGGILTGVGYIAYRTATSQGI